MNIQLKDLTELTRLVNKLSEVKGISQLEVIEDLAEKALKKAPNITRPSKGESLEELLKELPCGSDEELAELEFLCDEELMDYLVDKAKLSRDLRKIAQKEGLSVDEVAQKLFDKGILSVKKESAKKN